MSEEKEQKKLKDYSGLVSSTVPPLVQATKQNPALLSDTLQQLLVIEKKTRLAADLSSSLVVVNAILDLCHECKDWKALSEQITLLCKRRAQLNKVHEVIIQRSTAWVNETPDEATKRALIDVLRTVSAGKMFAELERGRLTRILAELEEKAGKIALAADILQEVQVETIGAMQIREKVDFLLEQVRLCLAKNDYVRAEIIAKKIATKTLESEDMQDLKLRYYRLMILFHEHNGSYLSICRCFKAIFDTPQVQADPVQWREALKNFVIFLVLSPFDSEVSDMLHRIKLDKKVAEMPVLKLVLELFTTDELMAWPLQSDAEWKKDAIFQGDAGRNKYNDLRKRVVQHNIRTISKYYSRVTTARLCNLISQPADIAEEYISELVSSGQLYARIDRPAGIVSFVRKETAHSALNTWSADISDLLTLVEKTNHLITKEYMLRDNARKQAD